MNVASVLQYIIPWKDFLKQSFSIHKPNIVCITRFPNCEDASEDAFAIHNLKNCGSYIVNLFSLKSIEKFMDNEKYELVS